MDYGGDILWPPATNLALRVNLPSILISKILCVVKCLNDSFTLPSFICSGVTPLKSPKATQKLAIYFSMIFIQNVVSVC